MPVVIFWSSPAGLPAVTPLALRVSLLRLSGAHCRSEWWLALLHRYHCGSSESPGRNLCVQALEKSKRLLHLDRQQCRWQEHISALGAAFACPSSIATSHTLCSCHHHPCDGPFPFKGKNVLPIYPGKDSPRLGFFCLFVPLLQPE